jgi:hypothetical protein
VRGGRSIAFSASLAAFWRPALPSAPPDHAYQVCTAHGAQS